MLRLLKDIFFVLLIVILFVALGVATWMGKYPPLGLPERRRLLYGLLAVLTGCAAAVLLVTVFPT